MKLTITNKIQHVSLTLLSATVLNQALFTSTSATAQESADNNEIEKIIVTGTRQEQALKTSVFSGDEINAQTLEMIAHTHVQESLLRIPGANFARGNGQEYLPALRSPVLTGAGACGSILSAENGVPLRASGFCNINELFDANTEMAQAIEVIRGPSTVVFGSNAMHGIVNVITPDVAQNDGYLTLDAGPNNYARGKLSQSYSQGNHGFRGDFSYTNDGGYRDSAGFNQQKATLTHELDFEQGNAKTWFSYSHLDQDTAGYLVGEDAYKDESLRKTNPNPDAYRNSTAMRLASRWQLNAGDTIWQITPYLRHTRMDFQMHFLPGTPVEENGQDSLGLQSAMFTELSADVQFTAGLDVEFTDGFLKQTQAEPTQGSDFLQATIPQGKQYDYQVNAFVVDPFARIDWQLNSQLLISAGARFSYTLYQYDNLMLSGRTDEFGNPCGFGGCRYSRPEDSDDNFFTVSPKLGAVYELSDTTQVFANVSHGFRAPQATELYRLQRDQQVAELDPEEIVGSELGLRQQHQNFSWDLTAFCMKKSNVIFRDSDFFNVDNGKTNHQGLELGADYRFLEDWQLSLSASYADHTYDQDRVLNGVNINGNQVDSAPKHFGSMQLSWQPINSLFAELEWVHQGDYFTDPENLHSYEGHNVFNFRGTYDINAHFQLALRLLNITDELYAERADFSGFSGDRYFPGEPRRVYVGLTARW
ncbi:TonB-dependent receptor [Thalassotalea agarivorans]|uniref:Outer membrane receptor proteins, mostly Fe transport n=1 Tax=Thalassotalea agarivorans TaxID=349064 RepID=A0A1I0B2H9_THASX|nr:TonB-dependent receptor [Thalassotalea agarivorans]SET00953.1 Outer membrane receptor proteins, mostly Fe transport [Thalassotalea agarivorans]